MPRLTADTEARAVARLIAQIDSLDRERNRIGRRVVALFLVVFALALTLLVVVAREPAPAVPRSRPALPAA